MSVKGSAPAESGCADVREFELDRTLGEEAQRFFPSPLAYLMLDAQGQLLAANVAWLEMVGRARAEAVGCPLSDFLTPDSKQRFGEYLRGLKTAEGSSSVQLEVVPKTGSTIAVEFDGRTERDEATDALLIHGFIRSTNEQLEIEGRNQIEQRLRNSRNRFRSLVEITSDFIWEVDQDLVFTYASPKVRDLLGYEPEEVVGKTPFDLMPDDERDRLADFARERIKTSYSFETLEATHLHKDGRRIVLETSGVPILDDEGNWLGFRGIGRDVTDRKQAEEALQQSHEELQTIYDGLVDGLAIGDMETRRFVRANAAMCRMLGYSEDEILSMSVMDIHPPEEVPRLLRRFLARAETRWTLPEEIPLLRKDGTVFYADITTNMIVYQGRRCMIGLFRDITERKEAQETIEKEHHALRQMLESQDRDRQWVTYEIHDGLAQQLAGAVMQLQAYREIREQNPETARKLFDAGLYMIGRSLDETRRLISGLRPPILDESGIVAAIGHLVNDISTQSGLEVEFNSRVKFDRLAPMLENSVYRVAQECLTNVLRHSRSERVQIELTQHDDQLCIEVRDWGIGFDPSAVSEGCLGLESIKERVRLLGGQAAFDSVAGRGTHVVVNLPLALAD